MREVLIIDQDSLWVDLIREALAEQDVGVRVSGDGAEALQLVRTGNLDAVVLSVDLRGMSGYSVCNRLKKDPALARVPLLLTSAEASEETFSQHSRLKTRAEAYLRKPFDKPALWRAMQEMWSPSPQPAARLHAPLGDALQDRTHPQVPPEAFGDEDGDDDSPGQGAVAPAALGSPADSDSASLGRDDLDVEATKVGDPAVLAPAPNSAMSAATGPALSPRPEAAAQPEAGAAAQPEVTVVRATAPEDVVASMPGPRRGAVPPGPSQAAPASEAPTQEPRPGSSPGPLLGSGSTPAEASGEPTYLQVGHAGRTSEHGEEVADLRRRLALAQAELDVARASAASLRAQREWAEQATLEVLRLLRAPSA